MIIFCRGVVEVSFSCYPSQFQLSKREEQLAKVEGEATSIKEKEKEKQREVCRLGS